MSKVILVLFLLLITFIVVMTILLVKKNDHKLPITTAGGGCWTGVGVQGCPSDEELKSDLASNINTTLCNHQDENGNWTCPDKILNKSLNGAPGKKIKDYLKCVCNGNGVCNEGICACNKDGNLGSGDSCAPAPPSPPPPQPPSAWFCTDPKTGTCKEEPIATGIQSGCASVNPSIKHGATTEEECKISCFPKINGKCSGDVGYCHTIPDGILNKGQFCGCPWNQDACGGNCPDSGPTGCWWNGGGLATAIKCRTGKVAEKHDFLWRGMQCD